MIYLALILLLAFGGLYLHDRITMIQNDKLELELKDAEDAYNTLKGKFKDEEDKREVDIGVLIEHQAGETRRLNTVWSKRLAALTERQLRQTTALEEKLYAYITPAADRRCIVPIGAVLFHNAAARADSADQGGAALPAAPGGSVDIDSGIRLSAAFATVARNYAGAREALDRAGAEISAWRAWYVAQRALFNTQPGAAL